MSQVVRIAAARDTRWLLRSRRAFISPGYISLGLFLAMCCWLAPSPLLAQSVIPSNPALHHNPYALPRHDVESQFDMAVSTAQLASENSVPTWTCMAFQSYRDGNWEVYARPSGATEPVRYTDDPASDAAPDVNRGCTHLVFESNRGVDGVYTIYSVALDGSGLAALTNSGLRSNHSPAWSPDGRQILFVSERTDNQDVFVMNADGSGQTQLTFAGEDDFSPTWSPDGRKILWVRQTSDTEGVLMLANADGSGEEALTSPLSYLRNPAYSNDAQWIAFDYDANADYWNDVGAMWVSPTAHGDDLMWHAGGNLADLWVNTWSPVEPDYDETMGLWERRSLIVSRVQYAIEDNRLVVQEIQLVDVVYGETYGTSYLDFDLAWRAADVTPPTVSFPRLPRYMPVYDPDLTDDPGIQLIHVSAADSGPSYLHRIDVEQVDSSGTVISGGMPGETVDMSLVTQPGATANIRARSVDAAGNASPWISRTTTGYSRIIVGSITDARAVPLSTEQLDLHFDPPAFLVRESPHGRFEALFPGLDATAAVWSTGTIYGNLDRQVPISALVTSFEAYMMPAEGMPNGIVNGSFSFSPATTEWVLRGPAVDLEMSGPSAPSIRFGDGTAPVVTTTSTLTQGVDMSRLGSEIHEPTLTFMYEISAGDATASAAQRRDLDVNTTLRSGAGRRRLRSHASALTSGRTDKAGATDEIAFRRADDHAERRLVRDDRPYHHVLAHQLSGAEHPPAAGCPALVRLEPAPRTDLRPDPPFPASDPGARSCAAGGLRHPAHPSARADQQRGLLLQLLTLDPQRSLRENREP